MKSFFDELVWTESIDFPYKNKVTDTCYSSRESYLCSEILPSCGCGDPLSIGYYVKTMIESYVGQENWDKVNYDDLPTMFFLSWADRQGFTEHGTTIRCSWLTEKGEMLLRDLQTFDFKEFQVEEEKIWN